MKTIWVFLFLLMTMGAIDAQELYPYKLGNHFVYVDSLKNVRWSEKYDFAYPFKGSIALVEVGDKYGVINKQGGWVVKPKFDYIEIEGSEQTQLIVTANAYNAWYRIYNWELLPDANIFSANWGPLFRTTVSRTHWIVFNKEGKSLCSTRVTERPYFNKDRVAVGECPYEFPILDSQAVVVKQSSKIMLFVMQKGSLQHIRSFGDAFGFTNTGVLCSSSDSSAVLKSFDKKALDCNKLDYVRGSFLYRKQKEMYATPSFWRKGDGEYVCLFDDGMALNNVPEKIMKQAGKEFVPLANTGLYWIRTADDRDVGIINSEGEWLLQDLEASLEKVFFNGEILFYKKSMKRYYLFSKNQIFEFPENTETPKRVKGMNFLIRQRSEDDTFCGVYDVENKRWHLPIMPFYVEDINLNFYFYERKEYKGDDLHQSSTVKYGIIDTSGTNIMNREYKWVYKTDDSNLVLVKTFDSDKEFYIKLDTAEELRKQ